MAPFDDRERPAEADDGSTDDRSIENRSADDRSTDDRAATAGAADERTVNAAAARSRRRFLAATGTAGVLALAGCSAEPTGDDDGDEGTVDGADGDRDDGADGDGDDDGDGDAPTLTVATYESFVDAPSTSPGEWIREAFAERHGVEIEWATPSNGVNHYVERQASGAEVEADLFVGLTTDDLVRVDRALDDPLFAADAFVDVEAIDDVREELMFDPRNRAIPYATNYVSLVYDGTATEAPATFEGLLEEEHRGALIAQNPGGSTTGRAFLLHTVHRFGADDFAGEGGDDSADENDTADVYGGDDGEDGYDYLDFWADLQDNDVRVLGSWNDAYAAWSGGEAPMVVSYSTDQVFAAAEGADLAGHQVRFLDDQAYANPEGAALFADADEPELARELLAFLLEPEVQGEIAERNVQFPATTTADLDDDYAELAQEPAEPVTFTYEELEGSVEGWIEAWERQFAGG